MKKGISELSFPPGMSLEEIFEISQEAGFEGIELMVKEKGELSIGSREETWEKVRNLSKKNNLEVMSLVSLLQWEYPLTSPHREVRDKSLDITKRMIEMAPYLGVEKVLIIPGMVSRGLKGEMISSYETTLNTLKEILKKLLPLAEKKGVTLCLENVWNKFLLSPLEFRELIDEFSHPLLKVYFDVGNVLLYGFPEDWIRILGERIALVHVKDYRLDIGTSRGFVPLLQGDVNWREVVKALKEIGYEGYLIAEIGPYRGYPLKSIWDTSSSMDYILSLEKEK